MPSDFRETVKRKRQESSQSSRWKLSWQPDWSELRLQLLKIGYATTIGIIILLIWLGFIEK